MERLNQAPGACRIVTVDRQLTAVVKVAAAMSAVPEAERGARRKLSAAMPSFAPEEIGAGFTLWRPPANGVLSMEPGVIVTRDFAPIGEVVPSALPAGRAASFLLKGSYEGMAGAWQTLFDWCKAEKLTLAGVNWQLYGPFTDKTEDLETTLFALLA